MIDTNLVIVTGRMTRDPDCRTTNTGTAVADFGIAVGNGESTYFGSVTAWNHTADYVRRYGRKGARVLVQGRLTREAWTDRNGAKQERTRITAGSLTIFSDHRGDPAAPEQGDLPYES